jgi:hypothetical protein
MKESKPVPRQHRIPRFKTLKEESEFWDTHSILDYLDDTGPVEGPLVIVRPRRSQRSSAGPRGEIPRFAQNDDRASLPHARVECPHD